MLAAIETVRVIGGRHIVRATAGTTRFGQEKYVCEGSKTADWAVR